MHFINWVFKNTKLDQLIFFKSRIGNYWPILHVVFKQTTHVFMYIVDGWPYVGELDLRKYVFISVYTYCQIITLN